MGLGCRVGDHPKGEVEKVANGVCILEYPANITSGVTFEASDINDKMPTGYKAIGIMGIYCNEKITIGSNRIQFGRLSVNVKSDSGNAVRCIISILGIKGWTY